MIAPCYDRRSCFFAEILGLELTRAGRTFLGRYTTPWEYFVASPPPPHVAEWQRQRNTSTWSSMASSLAGIMAAAAYVPFLNLLIPVAGTAAMVHVLDLSLIQTVRPDKNL